MDGELTVEIGRPMVILGTRAEFIKMMPILREFHARKRDYDFIHTGQHDLLDLCRDFGVKEPDVTLSEPPKGSSKFYGKVWKAIWWNISLLWKVRQVVAKRDPGVIFIHGDTMTTALASIASSRLFHWFSPKRCAHVEAGLRSGSVFEPFPEEISRKVADYFSGDLFAVSERSEKNLQRWYYSGAVHTVGNTIVDAVAIAQNMKPKRKMDVSKKYAVCTLHRHENITNRGRLAKFLDILAGINVTVYLAMHDNTKRKLEEFGLMNRLTGMDHVKMTGQWDYVSFIHLLAGSSLVLTDGGSIQEECFAFSKPCVLLRNRTERQEGVELGVHFLSCFDVKKTGEWMKGVLKGGGRKVKNPYGSRGVTKRIFSELGL